MEDVAPAAHEVVVYTDLLEVKGELKAWPPRRMLDVLNTRQTPYLEVEQASILPLSHWGKAQPTVAEIVVLNEHEVILVWLVREAKVEALESAAVHKIPRQVVAYAGPYVAQGTIHTIPEATLSQGLDAARELFLPLTEPSVYCLSVPGLSLQEGIVLGLNKERLTAMQARP